MLNRIKEYKELIAIIVFFLGGFLWLERNFPAKEDLESTKRELESKIEESRCVSDKQIEITQWQMRERDLEKHIDDLNGQINMYSDTRTLPPTVKEAIENKKLERQSEKADLKDTKTRIQEIFRALEINTCRKKA